MRIARLTIIPAILWLIVSTILLTLPGSKIPQEDWLSKIWFDKWVHIILFALLTWLWCRVVPQKTKRFFYLIGLACLLYGIAMEFVQLYCIAHRSFDGLDIVADAVGCLVGVAVSVRRYIKK